MKKIFAKCALHSPYSVHPQNDAKNHIKTAMGLMTGFAFLVCTDYMVPPEIDNAIYDGNEKATMEYTNAIAELKDGVNNKTVGRSTNSLGEKDLSHLFRDFGASLIVDSRLNETQKAELIEEFERSLGSFYSYTGIHKPESEKISEASERTPMHLDEYNRAKAIAKNTKLNYTSYELTTSAFLLGILLSCGAFSLTGKYRKGLIRMSKGSPARAHGVASPH